MPNKYLGRDDAPFGDDIWSKLDETVISVAKSQLSGRKLLDIEGPYGLALKSVPLNDAVIIDNDAKVLSSDILSIPLIMTEFSLSMRDLFLFQ